MISGFEGAVARRRALADVSFYFVHVFILVYAVTLLIFFSFTLYFSYDRAWREERTEEEGEQIVLRHSHFRQIFEILQVEW